MKTQAQQVADLLNEGDFSSFTLYGGYAMRYNAEKKGFDTVRFAGGVQEHEKVNKNGRVIYSQYIYSDGSRLEYRYLANQDRFSIAAIK